MTPSSGPLRSGYLAAAKGLRRALDGTRILESWTRYSIDHPRSALSHLRTLLAVHDANDLVRLDLPWWTYQAIDVVEEHLSSRRGKATVFEYGAGASTLWLARRSGEVTSIEHHPEWADRVRSMIAQDDGLLCIPEVRIPTVAETSQPKVGSRSPNGRGLDFENYVRSIDDVGGPFDLILIDGRAREACLKRAVIHAGSDSLILLDDAQRRRYRSALREAELAGWHVKITRGATPCQPLPRQTALLSQSPLASGSS